MNKQGKNRSNFPWWSNNFWLHSEPKKKKKTVSDQKHYSHIGGRNNTPIGSQVIGSVEATFEWSSADSNVLYDGLEDISVILPGLIGKTEETKENKGAENSLPTRKLQDNLGKHVTTPFLGSKHSDAGKVVMNIVPTDPWVKGLLGLNTDVDEGKRYSEQDFHTSEARESKESIARNVAVAREQGLELGTVFVEGNDSQDTVGCRNESDEYGR